MNTCIWGKDGYSSRTHRKPPSQNTQSELSATPEATEPDMQGLLT